MISQADKWSKKFWEYFRTHEEKEEHIEESIVKKAKPKKVDWKEYDKLLKKTLGAFFDCATKLVREHYDSLQDGEFTVWFYCPNSKAADMFSDLIEKSTSTVHLLLLRAEEIDDIQSKYDAAVYGIIQQAASEDKTFGSVEDKLEQWQKKSREIFKYGAGPRIIKATTYSKHARDLLVRIKEAREYP